ncbi:MAG: ribosome biogenesis GTPase YlqF [Erysipelotrichia bacterium]|nr:ribosome biogenesis GTPase YlqF [Erysipelotrichia bacterium]
MNNDNKVNINWYPGHMAKAKREIQEKIKLVDMVIEIRDARIPLSSENPLLKEIINNKPTLVVLSKADRAEKEITKNWITYFQQQGKEVLALNLLADNVSTIISNACTKMMENKINRLKSKGLINVEIKAMVLGIPNVGKSTLINSVSKRKIAKIADKPGVTRNLQWIKISKEVSLLDTPGVLWPKLENQDSAYLLAITGAINDNILPIEDVVVYAINFLIQNHADKLRRRYDIEVSDDVHETLKNIAISRKCFLKENEIDEKRVYALILKDIRNNQLGAISWEKYEN